MNLRKLKRNIYARMWRNLFYGQPIGQSLGTFRNIEATPLVQVFRDAAGINEKPTALGSLLLQKIRRDENLMALAELVEPTVLTENEIFNS